MYYSVYDSLGNFMRAFKTFPQASTYKFTFGNPGWVIKEKY